MIQAATQLNQCQLESSVSEVVLLWMQGRWSKAEGRNGNKVVRISVDANQRTAHKNDSD